MAFLAPTPPSLAGSLAGTALTVDLALKQPQRITNRIAALAANQTIVDKFFHVSGQPVTGGAVLYDVLKASDFYVKGDVHQRAPGDEYEIVSGADPDTKIAYIEDWGGKFAITDQAVRRNDTRYFDDEVTRLANTIARKIDTRAMLAVEAALADGANTFVGNSWQDLVTVGDPATLTPSAKLPTADLSTARLLFTVQDLGITPDLLIVNPAQAHYLRVAYGSQLEAMLKSSGLSMFENNRIAQGVAYVVQKGQAGSIAFEQPLSTESWRKPENGTSWVQSAVQMTFATDKPYAIKKIVGLNAP